jgi:vancomycin permeability regulator SanA
MRYVIAMSVAVVVAALATMFVSSPVASWVVRQFTFDNPDSVASLHAAAFMGCNLAALVIGFGLGWAIGPRERSSTR